jgi:transposase InsO family protein
VAGYRAPYEPPRAPRPEPHIDVERPGELVGFDYFYLGRLRGTSGAIWQLTAIDVYSSFAWAELVVCKQGSPTAAQTSKLARRVAAELKAAGWQLERALADNGNEFKGKRFRQTIERLGACVTYIHAGRPQTNGRVEALHKTILDECWRPAFARHLYPRYSSLSRELERYLSYYDFDRAHHGRLDRGRIPADLASNSGPARSVGPAASLLGPCSGFLLLTRLSRCRCRSWSPRPFRDSWYRSG